MASGFTEYKSLLPKAVYYTTLIQIQETAEGDKLEFLCSSIHRNFLSKGIFNQSPATKKLSYFVWCFLKLGGM